MQVHEEACKIISITKNFIPEDKLTELLIKLDDDIGKKSENTTTKQLLAALRSIVDKPLPTPPFWLKYALYTLVVVHIILIFGVLGSFFILPFWGPLVHRPATNDIHLVLLYNQGRMSFDNLENAWRQRLKMKRIGGFVGHYGLKPIKKLIKRYLDAKEKTKMKN